MLVQWLMSESKEESAPVTTVTNTVYVKRESMRHHATQVLKQGTPTAAEQTTAPTQGAVNLW